MILMIPVAAVVPVEAVVQMIPAQMIPVLTAQIIPAVAVIKTPCQ
jgi:hypothetical protein